MQSGLENYVVEDVEGWEHARAGERLDGVKVLDEEVEEGGGGEGVEDEAGRGLGAKDEEGARAEEEGEEGAAGHDGRRWVDVEWVWWLDLGLQGVWLRCLFRHVGWDGPPHGGLVPPHTALGINYKK